MVQAVKLINNLYRKKLTPIEILSQISFSSILTNDYFFEIAGLRAFRLLFWMIVKEYGFEQYMPYDLFIFAQTRIDYNESDPNKNMLSNTIQAMSGLIGGANALVILPYKDNSFSYRIARNIGNILKEESFLNKVVDPVSGAYYIEKLTDKIAQESWLSFQEKLSKINN